MCHAAMLREAQDWLHAVTQYTTFLCGQRDTNRLRGLCEQLLGPLHGQPEQQSDAMDVDMPGAASSVWTCAVLVVIALAASNEANG